MSKARTLAAVSLLITSGCASGYHDYACGCTSYIYCQRPALPYVAYDACCPTPVASGYPASTLPVPSAETIATEPAATPVPSPGNH